MDYDTYRGVCCSATGVPDYVPSVIWRLTYIQGIVITTLN
jgi:hypothetical protein